MSIRRVVTYEPTCDECWTPADEYMDRKEVVADLRKDGSLYKRGWRKQGKRLLCSECVRRTEGGAKNG